MAAKEGSNGLQNICMLDCATLDAARGAGLSQRLLNSCLLPFAGPQVYCTYAERPGGCGVVPR